ncbi:unnamed protein product [Pleuronectes platessa]|uniref:Uncharacterized protein n=1 Tax=Pleuronectes platessa TaxID=8262 RepID=A0A9N7YTS7_PLEPL|nr:unnamed protein product [Pleuronectes platessa]
MTVKASITEDEPCCIAPLTDPSDPWDYSAGFETVHLCCIRLWHRPIEETKQRSGVGGGRVFQSSSDSRASQLSVGVPGGQSYHIRSQGVRLIFEGRRENRIRGHTEKPRPVTRFKPTTLSLGGDSANHFTTAPTTKFNLCHSVNNWPS